MNKKFDMLDKDIKILREFTESSCCLYSQEEIIEATKNVLSELEKKDLQIKINTSHLALLNDLITYIFLLSFQK